LPDGLADTVVPADEPAIAVVGDIEDMVRPAQDRDDAWRVLEQALQARDFIVTVTLRQHLVCRFHDHTQHSPDLPGFCADGRVRKGEPDLFIVSPPMDRQWQVLREYRFASHRLLDVALDSAPYLGPHFVQRRTHR
jgi:hypothetical protein